MPTLRAMPAEARITSIWKKQKLFVSIFVLAFGAWFFWDAMVGYPRNNARYKIWKSYADQGRENEWTEYAKQKGLKPNEWPNYVREHNLAGNLPDEPFGRDKIAGQYVFGSIATLIGAITLAYWATQRNRVIRTDGETVQTPSGRRVPFSAVTGIGKKKWEAKGLATVRYEIDGKKGEFVLDDYKFEREPTHQILAEIEEALLRRAT